MFFRAKKIELQIEEQVEKVLAANSVSRARQIMGSRSGVWTVITISFIESALPIPLITDPFLMAAILMQRANAARLVFLTVLSSTIGGVFAYFMALFFLNIILGWMTPGMITQFNALVDSNQASTFVLTIVGAVTPVPYTLVAWTVAVTKGNLLVFIVASVIGRGLRYGIVGYCVYWFGPTALSYAKRYIGFTSIVIVICTAIFIWLKM